MVASLNRFFVFSVFLGLVSVVQANEAGPAQEQLHMKVQRICPVSGLELGAHGPPVKVVVGEHQQEVYLCCKACMERQIDPAHWATIHQNIATAQRICPVMKHPLPEKASWQIIKGRVVFVCCPPCLEKIAKNPDSHLKQIDDLYSESLVAAAGSDGE